MPSFHCLSRICQLAAIQAALVLAAMTQSSEGAPPQPVHASNKLPSLATVKAAVEGTLNQDRDYRPGDLLSQKRVAAVFSQLKAAGWDVPQSRELAARVPADNEFLVRALSTKKGIQFMRTVANMSGGYDRVDRLSRLPNGQQLVERLINGPDGHKLIGYLTESRGGQELGGMLGRTAHDADFNRPTGRIYTAKQLLGELGKLHAAANKP
ncbi:MAG: hypothetical protein WD894_08675 [Pirellulales bacterium]